MSDARLAIIISAVDHASKELKSIKNEIGGLGDAGEKASKSGLQKLKDGFSAAKGAALKAYAAFKITKKAVDKVYQAAREGADLVYLEQRFDNLSRSIGTTSSALMMDLRSAVKGTKSDMELMAGASDMLALGLAKSHDQAVRLTAVAGALGWNMDQLTLTITNETTKRLDTLGLSVESVKGRYEALKEAGIEGQQAMTQAIIEAGEAMITLQGHVGDTTLGAFQRMEASQSNFFNAMKENLAEGATGWAEFWTNVYDSASHAVRRQNVIDSIGSLIPELNEKIESAVEKNLETADKSFSELYGMYASGTGSIGFAVADNLAIKKSWDELLDLPGAEAAMIGVQNQFERLSEGSRRYLSEKIDWERYLNNEYYRATVDEMIDKSLEYAESIKTTGATYDVYEDQQEAVVRQYEKMAAARKQAIDDGVKAHYDMQGALQGIAGETDKVSAAMTLWLSSQQGMTTFVGLLRTYTVELEGIKEKKARIVELEEIVKNNGGIYDGQKISAEQARKEIEKLNEAIDNSHQRMKDVVKDAIVNAYIQQVMAGTESMGEKFNQIFGFLEKHGLASKEALQALREELGLYEDDIADFTGAEHVVNVQTEVDKKELDDLRKDIENYKSDLKVKTVLDSGETDDYEPPSKNMWVDAQLNALNVENYGPPTKNMWVDAQLNALNVENYETPTNKKLKVSIELDTKAVDGYNPPTLYGSVVYLPNKTEIKAAGGTVQAAAAGRSTSPRGNYLWQEYGYRGEIFVPSMDGYILSKADAARAVSAGSANMDYEQLEMAVESAFNRALDRYDNKLRPTAVMSRASAFENTARWR
jgi:hypothetical protein